MDLLLLLVTAAIIGIVCGYALYAAAKRDNRNPVVWGIVGFLTNIVGVVVYRLTVGPIMKP